MFTIADVLSRKNDSVLTINPLATAFAAIQRMVERNVGSILIVEEDGRVAGIFTERDYLRRIVMDDRSPDTPVRNVMSANLICAELNDFADECMSMMTQFRIRHIPVMENGWLVGIVSGGDLMKNLSIERSFEVKQLTDYITGQYPGELGQAQG